MLVQEQTIIAHSEGRKGQTMSQEAAITKLETICCSLWRQHQSQGDSFDLACRKLLESTQTMDQRLGQATTNDLLAQLAQQREKWTPPWKRKQRQTVHFTMSPMTRGDALADGGCIVSQQSQELFHHPAVEKVVNKLTIGEQQYEPYLEELCLQLQPENEQRTWEVDFTKVNSAYWSAVKTIKKRKHNGSPVMHNNPFDPRLKYRGVPLISSDTAVVTEGSPYSNKRCTVNAFLTVPDVSAMLESHCQCYREFCNDLTAPAAFYSIHSENSVIDWTLPFKYENLRSHWESDKSNSASFTVRRPHTSKWKQFADPVTPPDNVPTEMDMSRILGHQPRVVSPEAITSTPAANTTDLSSTDFSPSSTSSSSILSTSSSCPEPPSPFARLLLSAKRPGRRVRRRLWDDNDLLVTSSCRGLYDDDEMGVFPLTVGGKSQSDPHLSRSFSEASTDAPNLTKWGKNYVDLDKLEFFPKDKGESDADHASFSAKDQNCEKISNQNYKSEERENCFQAPTSQKERFQHEENLHQHSSTVTGNIPATNRQLSASCEKVQRMLPSAPTMVPHNHVMHNGFPPVAPVPGNLGRYFNGQNVPVLDLPDFTQPPPSFVNKPSQPFQPRLLKRPIPAEATASTQSVPIITRTPNTIYSIAGANRNPRDSSSFTNMAATMSRMDPTRPAFYPQVQPEPMQGTQVRNGYISHVTQATAQEHKEIVQSNKQAVNYPHALKEMYQLLDTSAVTPQKQNHLPPKLLAPTQSPVLPFQGNLQRKPFFNPEIHQMGNGFNRVNRVPFFPNRPPMNYQCFISPVKSQKDPPGMPFLPQPPPQMFLNQPFIPH